MTSLSKIAVKRLIVSVIVMIIGVVGMMFILGCASQDKFSEHNAEALVHEATEHEMVRFNDKKLESAIIAALSGESLCSPGEMVVSDRMEVSNGIMVEDLTELTSLCVGNMGVTDLSGLEYCTNLTVLNLDRNEISDISVLSSLTNLTVLGLANNQVNDISSLATLNHLEYLYIGDNQISDVSPLHSLDSLRVLSLYSNQISDISPLGSLTKLTLFDIRDNQINDISTLDSWDNLTMLILNIDPISEGSETMKYVRALEDRGVVVRQDPLPTT